MPQVEMQTREFYLDYITPDADNNIKANATDMFIIGVALLLDIRDILLDLHGIARKATASTGGPRIIVPK